MGERNTTSWTEFVLLGFSDLPHLRVPLFVTFLLIYLLAISGNLLVMSVIYSDTRLHTPMYFFLSNLSFADIFYISITVPKMLVNFFLEKTCITLQHCLLQMHLFMALVTMDYFLLTIMSYDRYIAICKPLHYTRIMSKSICVQLATGVWIIGLTMPTFYSVPISQFSFCDSNEINHFFCDFPALMQLSCTSTHIIDGMTYILGVVVLICSCLLIISSYVKIICAILKIQTSTGRYKAFSTCASHITVVILYYGVLLFTYIRPASMYSVRQSKILSFIYSAAIPMCNPIIYTLKNKEFANSLQRRRIKGH